MAFDPVQILNERFVAAMARAFPEQAAGAPGGVLDPLIAPSKSPKFGDFQCNAAMALAKAAGRNPREVAQAIVRALGDGLSDLAEPITEASIAGPGFINITLRPEALCGLVARFDTASLGIEPPERARTIVVDLCGVNLAKQMHVGHIRAVIIGDAIARAFERLGHRVIRQNHVGDWGLNIAMVTAKLMELERKRGPAAVKDLTLDDLERLYKESQRECDADERGLAMVRRYYLGPKAEAEIGTQVEEARAHLAAAKATLVKLQSHDPATYAVWKRIAELTMKACLANCARLGAVVLDEHSAGESSYAEELAPMVEELVRRGITEESDGALVIRVPGLEEPCIIRKSDGGFLYATTDMAAIRRRVQKFGAERVIYCVDARQGLHFRQVFGAAHRAGFDVPPGRTEPASLEHAAFGTILGQDGKPFKTRSGESVKLAELLEEAVERAGAAVAEKAADLSPTERREVAEAIGIAAIKYADLSNDRVKDYVFDFDRMLGFEGNTGPYLMYAAVRIRNIFRKGGVDPASLAGVPIAIGGREEKDLALTLLRYPGAVRAVAQGLEPHRLCQYLYELASAFSSFYTNCPVLAAPDEATKRSRLRLCAITQCVLEDGLGLLGIRALERM